MIPVEIKGGNANFSKPIVWDDELDGPCGVLSVRRAPYGRYSEHSSNWKPDAEELKLLNSGGVVELCCVGVQPPVSVSVVDQYIKGDRGV
jgi:hypothetical protein